MNSMDSGERKFFLFTAKKRTRKSASGDKHIFNSFLLFFQSKLLDVRIPGKPQALPLLHEHIRSFCTSSLKERLP